jgi:hypothetical protein
MAMRTVSSVADGRETTAAMLRAELAAMRESQAALRAELAVRRAVVPGPARAAATVARHSSPAAWQTATPEVEWPAPGSPAKAAYEYAAVASHECEIEHSDHSRGFGSPLRPYQAYLESELREVVSACLASAAVERPADLPAMNFLSTPM